VNTTVVTGYPFGRGGGRNAALLSDKAASRGHDKRNICICEGEDNIKAVFKGVGSWDVG